MAEVERALAALRAVDAGSSAGAAAGEDAVRMGHLLVVLGRVCASALGPLGARQGRERPGHPAMVAAARLLEDDPAAEWSLTRLAGRVHVSAAYLVRLFSQHMEISPMAYLTRLRAERAAALLIESDRSVTEIGRIVGWRDPSYMSRRFSGVFGMAPTAYRRAFRPQLGVPPGSDC